MKISPYIPNKLRDGVLALVPIIDGKPNPKAWYAFKAFQIFGGKTWSLSIIRLGEVQKDNEEK